MKTLIYQIEFDGFVHFGKDIGSLELESADYFMRSDTLYSALCIEMLKIYGEEKFNDFINSSKAGKFLISDLMPYNNEKFYIPKPYFSINKAKNPDESTDISKKLKNLKYISVEKLEEYYMGNYNIGKEKDKEIAFEELIWKNSIDSNHIATPFVVSSFRFKENTGLYFILQIDEEWLDVFNAIIDSLSTAGIGGKKSIGYGKFKLFDDPIEIFFDDDSYVYEADRIIKRLIKNKNCKYNYLLSSLMPIKDNINDLKESCYHLIKRSGFVDSLSYSDKALKKKQVAMISSGSTLVAPIKGNIIDLSEHGNHPVYRNGLGLYLGVDIDE